MQILTRRPALRWLAPLALVLVVGGTGLVATQADADPTLPAKSPEQLLVDVANARPAGLSGTVTQSVDLGLPALPASGRGGGSDLTSLLSGSHTLRVWYASPDRARFALLDDLGETDVILDGRDVWTWKSDDNEATHTTLPSGEDAGHAGWPGTGELPVTPQQAAERALAAVGPSTAVSTDRSVTVAGRDAYELVLTPKDSRSLIGRVAVAVDAETSVPLRVQTLDHTGASVFDVAFTTVDFAAPDADQFAFNPPPGAEVTEKAVPEHEAPSKAEREAAEKAAREHAERAQQATEVVGEGWTTVVVAPASDDQLSGQLASVVNQLEPVSGPWGSGRLLAGTAFSAVLTDDGRVAVGAVAPELLYDALAR